MSTGRSTIRATRTTIVMVASIVALSAVVWWGLDRWARRHGFFDLHIYQDATRWWLDGNVLYEYVKPYTPGLGFTYPPFSAVLMAPMAFLSFDVVATIAVVTTAAAITMTTWWIITPVAEHHGWPRWYAVGLAVPLVSTLDPIHETMAFGQVNMYLYLLVLFDAWALARGYRFAGIGIGLAAAIKITPAFFIIYLLVTSRGRAALTAVITAAGATLFAAVLSPPTSWAFWTDVFWQNSRVGSYDDPSNQSLMGLLARLADPDQPSKLAWLGGALLIAALGLWRARHLWLDGDELAALSLAGITACLVSPISWTHHLYWMVPAIVVLIDAGLSRRTWGYFVLGLVTFGALAWSSVWHYDRLSGSHYDGGFIGVVGENSYALLCLVLLVCLPAREGMRRLAPPRFSDTRTAKLVE